MSKLSISSFYETSLVSTIAFDATSCKLQVAREQVTGEVIETGDGNTDTFAGSLDANDIQVGDLVITDGVETFSDNGDGTLTGDAGGTGTIDYDTGAYTLDFNADVGNGTNVTATYRTWLIPAASVIVFDPDSSNEEGAEYSARAALSTLGATLTLSKRGLAWIGFKRATTRKAFKHIGSSTVRLSNHHILLEQLIRVFQGLDPTDDDAWRIGQAADNDIYMYFQNADANKPYIKYDKTTNKVVVSDNGVDEYDISAGGGGLTAGQGIVLNAGAIDIDLATDPGLEFSSGDIRVKIKANGGIVRDSDGLSVDEADDYTWTGVHDFSGATVTLPAPTADSDAAPKDYVDLGNTKMDFTSGEAFSAGDALYLKTSDGKVYKTDAGGAESTFKFIGFAEEAATGADETIAVITDGYITTSGLTAGSIYYLDGSTAGGLTTTAGTNTLKVGVAMSTTVLKIERGPLKTTGLAADLVTTSNANNDLTITCGFKPKIIRLHYFIQGHSASTAQFLGSYGIGDFLGTTLINNKKIWDTPDTAGEGLSADNGLPPDTGSNGFALFFDNDPSTTDAITIGDASDVSGAASMTITINAVSETGFTIRRVSAGHSAGGNNRRAKIYWEAEA